MEEKTLEKLSITRDSLVMQYPASWWRDTWREALVCGNGHTGASFYGGTKEQTIMVTNGDLWYGGLEDELPDVHEHLEIMREKMDRGDYKEASWEIVNALKQRGYGSQLEYPLPLADLKIQIIPKGTFHQYMRVLQMDTGEASCQWQDSGVLYRCDGFVSRAEDIIMYRIQASEPVMEVIFTADVHRNPGMELPQACAVIEEKKTVEMDKDGLLFRSVNTDGQPYGMAVKITSDGIQSVEEGRIVVRGASRIVAAMAAFIKDADGSGAEKAKQAIERQNGDYEQAFSRHAPLHRSRYCSARLEFGGYEGMYNENLLQEAFAREQSPELMEKMWKFGRYLFISGTAEDADPFPLYGIWGGGYQLIWSHNMANENTQMIYWHSFVGNLAEYHRALFHYYNARMEIYRKNARNLFGCRGIYMTAGTTPNVSAPNQVVPVIINWTGAAGWLAQHYCQYAAYCPEEQTYIKETILPYLEEVAAFYEDFIRYQEDGSIKVYPSVSPENTPQNFMPPLAEMIAHPMPTTINSTIDLAIIKEFFTNIVGLSRKYGWHEEKIGQWEAILRAIPPYKTNELGAVREWQAQQFDDRYDHRHLSHIYPVFPGNEVNSVDHPQEMEKYKKAVELRKIDAQTGWSMAHMASIYARFDEGEKAAQCLDNMAKSCLLSNFFTLHNDWRGMSITLDMDPAPVQLDAALGYVNAVQEMILYASEHLLKLLPALPERLNSGTIGNFCYPNGTVSMTWNRRENRLDVEITSKRPHTVRVKLPEDMGPFQWSGAKTTNGSRGAVTEITFEKEGEKATGRVKKEV